MSSESETEREIYPDGNREFAIRAHKLSIIGEPHAYCVDCGNPIGYSSSSDSYIHPFLSVEEVNRICPHWPWLNTDNDPSKKEREEALADFHENKRDWE